MLQSKLQHSSASRSGPGPSWPAPPPSSPRVPQQPHARASRFRTLTPKGSPMKTGTGTESGFTWSPDSGARTSSGSRTPRCKTSPGGGGAHPLAPFHPAPNPNQAIERSRGGLCSYPQLRNQSHALLNTSFT